jgi:hypothetical protein
VLTTFPFPTNVAQGGNQRTILIGGDQAVDWPVEPDFTTPNLAIPADGAVCYLSTLTVPLDCVSFGSFSQPTSPLPTGSPASARTRCSARSRRAVRHSSSPGTTRTTRPPTSRSLRRHRATTRRRRPRRAATPPLRRRRSPSSPGSAPASARPGSRSNRASADRASSASSTAAASNRASRRSGSG